MIIQENNREAKTQSWSPASSLSNIIVVLLKAPAKSGFILRCCSDAALKNVTGSLWFALMDCFDRLN